MTDSISSETFFTQVKTAYQIGVNSGSKENIGLGNLLLAQVYYSYGDFQEAETHFKIALNNLQSSEMHTDILLKLGQTQSVLLKAGEALENIQNVLNYYKNKGNKSGQINTYIVLGEYFRKYKKFEQASEKLSIAEKLLTDSLAGSETGIKLYSRIAAVASEIGAHKKALAYSRKALNAAKKIGLKPAIASSLNEIAFLEEKNNFPESINHYIKAAMIRKNIGDQRGLASVYSNIIRWYFIHGANKQALTYLDTLENCFLSKNWPVIESEFYYYKTAIYERLGQYPKAFASQRNYYERKVELLQKETDKQIEEIQQNSGLKEKEWLIQKQQLELAEEKNIVVSKIKQEKILFASALIFLVLSVALVILHFNSRNSRKVLKLKNLQLNELLNEKHILVSEMHHRIKNNLALLSSLVNIQKFNQKDVKTAEEFSELQSRIDTISSVHQQMIHLESKPKIKVGSFFNKFIDDISSSIASANIFFIKNIQCPEVELSVKRAIPLALIINELITNSLKHGYKNQDSFEIGLTICSEDDMLVLSAYDSGNGLADLKILDSSDSFGMELINLLSGQIDAEISYEMAERSEFVVKFKL